ncbi:hypothetical protein BH10BAC2_BH10BAC2_46950 [soil metagenome]
MIAVAFMFYFFDTYLVLKISRVINFELSLPNSKLVVGLIILLPCEILVYVLTDNHNILEKKYIEEGVNILEVGGDCLISFLLLGLFCLYSLL